MSDTPVLQQHAATVQQPLTGDSPNTPGILGKVQQLQQLQQPSGCFRRSELKPKQFRQVAAATALLLYFQGFLADFTQKSRCTVAAGVCWTSLWQELQRPWQFVARSFDSIQNRRSCCSCCTSDQHEP